MFECLSRHELATKSTWFNTKPLKAWQTGLHWDFAKLNMQKKKEKKSSATNIATDFTNTKC